MKLKEKEHLLELWRYSLKENARVILMRHAPKSGSNNSDLSEEGMALAREYGRYLKKIKKCLDEPFLVHTDKKRTAQTLKLLFLSSDLMQYKSFPELNSPIISEHAQTICNLMHKYTGKWRGYYLNQTYYFAEELGMKFDKESESISAVGERMARGIHYLFDFNCPVIYCGHSPSIEAGCGKLMEMSITELGGFLNPLDSIHLSMTEDGKIKFIARINPIIDYVDLESEKYFEK